MHMMVDLVTDGRHNGIMDALNMATHYYAGKYDRCGYPVILHSLRVAMKQETDKAFVVALLHDLVEDEFCTLMDVRDAFDDEIAYNVSLLTREDGQSYMEYIKLLSESRVASMVKLADIEDNTNVRRMDKKAAERVPMYLKAYEYICEKYGIQRQLTISKI